VSHVYTHSLTYGLTRLHIPSTPPLHTSSHRAPPCSQELALPTLNAGAKALPKAGGKEPPKPAQKAAPATPTPTPTGRGSQKAAVTPVPAVQPVRAAARAPAPVAAPAAAAAEVLTTAQLFARVATRGQQGSQGQLLQGQKEEMPQGGPPSFGAGGVGGTGGLPGLPGAARSCALPGAGASLPSAPLPAPPAVKAGLPTPGPRCVYRYICVCIYTPYACHQHRTNTLPASICTYICVCVCVCV